MKKITLLFSLLITAAGFSQTVINFDTADFADGTGGNGFANWFDNPKNGSLGGFQFASGWGISDLVSIVDATTVTLKPNRIGDPDPYWQTSGVLEGNKICECNHFNQDETLIGQNLTFTGNVVSNTLDGSSLSFDYQAVVFIKVFETPSFALLDEASVVIPASGDFSVSLDASAYTTNQTIQFGFQVLGPNINSDPSFDTDYNNLGSIVVQAATLSNDDFKAELFSVSPNPTRDSWNITGLNTTINSIDVFDILGKRVQTLTPNQTDATIDGSNLKTGIYLAKINSDNGTKTIKLVKN